MWPLNENRDRKNIKLFRITIKVSSETIRFVEKSFVIVIPFEEAKVSTSECLMFPYIFVFGRVYLFIYFAVG
jgi:hypothetical protein